MAQTKEGSIKVAAQKAGISVREYIDRVSNGLKKCTICKDWKQIENFAKDKSRSDGLSSRCNDCSKAIWRRKSMTANSRIKRRSGDKKQAQSRINHDIKLGLRPNPDKLFCSLCGHKGDDRRHEYHHVLGYGADHHYDVLPLCSKCHHLVHSGSKNKKKEVPICQLV